MQSEKITKRYDDACGLAHALELIGERWALLVLRELMLGPRRFSELKADLPGISANVLTQRLTELERRGLVRKTKLPPPASVQVYEATRWGMDARPLMGQLGKWAARSPLHDPSLPISHVSAMLSLETYGKGKWRPPIVKTEATTGKGVGELVEQIEKFRTHTAAALGERRRARAEFRVRELMAHRFVQHVERRVLESGEFERLLDAIAARETDPYSVVEDIFKRAIR